MDYKAVFFDFDYTLGDATEAIVAGFNAQGLDGILIPGGFGARCGEKEAAAELQRGQQQRVPSGADSVIRPPGIPFSDIPGTDRTGNGHGPAA